MKVAAGCRGAAFGLPRNERFIHRAAADILGPEALTDGPWMHDYLESYSETIAGGTAEIQRNIIGERILGLPREARA